MVKIMNELLQIKGVGETSVQKLHQNHIDSIGDLIHTYPYKYEINSIKSIHEMVMKEEITIEATLEKSSKVMFIRKHLTKIILTVYSDEIHFQVSIFNREFLKNSLLPGNRYVIKGRFQTPLQMVASEIIKKENYIEGIIPVYRLENISSKVYLKWVLEGLKSKASSFTERLPQEVLEKNHLVSIFDFYHIVHSPLSMDDVFLATNRIKYEELIDFFLRLEMMKQLQKRMFVKSKTYQIDKVKKYIDTLPFELTEDQKLVTNEIFRDLKSDRQMNRLLQGDVGSGKTVCAMIASYAVVTASEQVAIMAPTEILAYQHYLVFKDSLEQFGVRISFLSSNVKGKEKAKVLALLKSGEIDIIIGTHSLIQEDVEFKNLGFIVIDEQHRFGVNQRKTLRKKGYTPDVLFMSATPIPRTLAITIFKDMEISSIKALPHGRKPVETVISTFEEMDLVFKRMMDQLDFKHQAYIIVPLIEENDDSKFISIDEFKAIIEANIPDNYVVDYLHGKMKSTEKENVLNRFYQNQTQILVSTTVVEVGVNVPNATFMIILNATKFGLSQLHQLRGRVGRSNHQAYCYLLTDGFYDEESRLDILVKTTDGFKISEADLKFRGPGEIFGNEQTGIPRFKMANFINDKALIESAIEDAKTVIFSSNPKAKSMCKITLASLETYHLD